MAATRAVGLFIHAGLGASIRGARHSADDRTSGFAVTEHESPELLGNYLFVGTSQSEKLRDT